MAPDGRRPHRRRPGAPLSAPRLASRPGRRLLAVAPVDHPGGAEIGLLRLLARLRPARLADHRDHPGAGTARDAARAAGYDWEPLALGGLGRRTERGRWPAGRGRGNWPRPRMSSISTAGSAAGCCRLCPAGRARGGCCTFTTSLTAFPVSGAVPRSCSPTRPRSRTPRRARRATSCTCRSSPSLPTRRRRGRATRAR